MKDIFDVHCHILPNVDDGAADLEEAIQMIKLEYGDGVRNIIFTPHYRRNMFETDRDTAAKIFGQVADIVKEKFEGMKLYLGCEYHIHSEMMEMLETDKRYRMPGGQFVLLEFSEVDTFSAIWGSCSMLQSSGYVPVIAHAERYPCLQNRMDRMEDLKDMGIRIQVNSGSILGKNGWGVKRFCRKLISRNLIDLIGSDAHNMRTRIPDMGECAAHLIKKYGTSYARRILIENPTDMIYRNNERN